MRLDLGLVGQIGDDRPVCLHAPQDVGRHQLAQRAVGIVLALREGFGVALELLGRAEQARIEKIEDRPQIAEMIFDRRAGERDSGARFQSFRRAGLLCAGVLDRLRLVENDETPGDVLERCDPQQRSVARDDKIETLRTTFGKLLHILGLHGRGMHDRGFEAWREFFDLAGPIGEQRSGRDNEARARRRVGAVALRKQQQRQDLDGLAETHVVGEAGPEPETADEPQPGDAGLLIGPQRALQRRAWISACGAWGPQGLQRLGEPRPGGDFRPAGAGGFRFILGHRRAGKHPHRLGETHPLASGEGFGVGKLRHRLFETGAIDLDPLAAQERQSVRSGEQRVDFRLRQRFAIERRRDLEIEQSVKAKGRRLAAADGRRRLGAWRPPGAPGRRHP